MWRLSKLKGNLVLKVVKSGWTQIRVENYFFVCYRCKLSPQGQNHNAYKIINSFQIIAAIQMVGQCIQIV